MTCCICSTAVASHSAWYGKGESSSRGAWCVRCRERVWCEDTAVDSASLAGSVDVDFVSAPSSYSSCIDWHE